MRYEYVTRWLRAAWSSEQQKKGMMGKTETVYDPHHVDMDDLSTRIFNACNELGGEGYEVISIVPVIRGHSSSLQYRARAEDVLSKSTTAYGFSVTEGVVITGKRSLS